MMQTAKCNGLSEISLYTFASWVYAVYDVGDLVVYDQNTASLLVSLSFFYCVSLSCRLVTKQKIYTVIIVA